MISSLTIFLETSGSDVSGRCIGGAVHAGAVGERLGQMRATHGGGAVEIGDGAGEFQDAMVSARRQGETLGRLAHESLRAGVRRGQFLDRARRRGGVGGDAGKADRRVTLGLYGARRRDAASDLRRAFRRGRQDEIGCYYRKIIGFKTPKGSRFDRASWTLMRSLLDHVKEGKKLVGLNLVFEQRKIGRQHTSLAAYVPLRTPSGAQETESQLETDLLVQLNFSPSVYDLITQPIINYTDETGAKRRYTPDVLVQLFPDDQDRNRYLMIEAKPLQVLERSWELLKPAFGAAREWCALNFADFHIVTEHEIRTPYLTNAVALSHFWNSDPAPHLMSALWDITDAGPVSVEEAIRALMATGASEPDGRTAIECAAANRYVACNLSQEFTDQTKLFSRDGYEINMLEPILESIRTSQRQHPNDIASIEKTRFRR